MYRRAFVSIPGMTKTGADNPTYLKNGTADTATLAFGGLLIFSGLAKVVTGLYHMSFGTHVLEIE